MAQGLVSIVTPCYNVENYICRLMESILVQDYPNVEMFAVDDGSSDKTLDVLNGYVPFFEKRGYKLMVVHQDNAGQSAAINNVLKCVHGDYIIWPDSDDWYHESSALSTFVKTFESLPSDYGVVRCPSLFVLEGNETEGIAMSLSEKHQNPEQFFNCLYRKDFFWGAGNYMISRDALDKVNPAREISVDRLVGQNWQLLLPVLYSYKCYTLSEPLHTILNRHGSHSRTKIKNPKSQIAQMRSCLNTILSTLEGMPLMSNVERGKIVKDIRKSYMVDIFNYACSAGLRSEAKDTLKETERYGIRRPTYSGWYLLCAQSKILNYLNFHVFLRVLDILMILVRKLSK